MTNPYTGKHRRPRNRLRPTRADVYTVALSLTAFLTIGFAWLARI